MDPKDYNGFEWDELRRQLSPRQLKNAMKSGYRAVARKIKRIADESLRSRGPKVQGSKSDWVKAVRTYAYSRGGGFMVTVKPYKAKGFHLNRFGKEKPVVMWAEDGTKERSTHSRVRTGKMAGYGFVKAVRPQMVQTVETELKPELDKAIDKAARKAGFIE